VNDFDTLGARAALLRLRLKQAAEPGPAAPPPEAVPPGFEENGLSTLGRNLTGFGGLAAAGGHYAPRLGENNLRTMLGTAEGRGGLLGGLAGRAGSAVDQLRGRPDAVAQLRAHGPRVARYGALAMAAGIPMWWLGGGVDQSHANQTIRQLGRQLREAQQAPAAQAQGPPVPAREAARRTIAGGLGSAARTLWAGITHRPANAEGL
jgi:hypothetical protein